jgi:hypothetical protein
MRKMAKNNFGFRQDKGEHEPTELEKRIRTTFVDSDKEQYPEYVGQFVEIFACGKAVWGVYRGTTEKGDCILLPHVVRRDYLENNGEQPRSIYHWDELDPSHIKLDRVDGIRGITKGYLDTIVSSSQTQSENISYS